MGHSARVYKEGMTVNQSGNVPDHAPRGANAEVMARSAERDADITIDDILSAVREGRRG